jgi:hypothetical protein
VADSVIAFVHCRRAETEDGSKNILKHPSGEISGDPVKTEMLARGMCKDACAMTATHHAHMPVSSVHKQFLHVSPAIYLLAQHNALCMA